MPKRGVRPFYSFIELIVFPFKWIRMQFKGLWESLKLKKSQKNSIPVHKPNVAPASTITPFPPESEYNVLKQQLIILQADMLKTDAKIYEILKGSMSMYVYQADAQTLAVYERACQIAEVSILLKQIDLDAKVEQYEKACKTIKDFLMSEWVIKSDFKSEKEESRKILEGENLSEKDYRNLIYKLEKVIQDKEYQLCPHFYDQVTNANLQNRLDEANTFLTQAKSFLDLKQKIVGAKSLVTEMIHKLNSAAWACTVARNPNNRELLFTHKITKMKK